MHSDGYKNNMVRVATKGITALVLLVVVFSPLQGVLQPVLVSVSVAHAAEVTAAQYMDALRQQQAQAKTPSCDWTPGSWDLCITNVVYVFTVGIMSVFAYIGAMVFSLAVSVTLNSASYALGFLSQGWTAVRDIANMAFIFILIYIAVTIILQADTSGTMKTLAGVVVMALLINFSFFITRVVIDTGNILAVQFYNAIPTQTIAQTAQGSGYGSTGGITKILPGTGNTKDLTYNIMNVTQIQTLFGSDSFTAFYKANSKGGANPGTSGFMVVLITLSLIYICVGAMFAILAFAFLTVGFKFLMRVVALWFVIISSPLAFAARALGNSNKKAMGLYDQWQSALIQFTFYPAIFLFMFWILNTFMVAMSAASGGNLVNGIFNDLNGSLYSSNIQNLNFLNLTGMVIASLALRMGFIVIMLYYGMKVADMVVTQGTEIARTASNWVGRRIGGLTYGGVGLAGRYTAGWAGQSFARSNTGRELAAHGGMLGRTLWRGANKLGTASYDARGVPGLRAGVLGLGGLHGGDIGAPGEGGWRAKFDSRVKRREEEAKLLKPSESKLDAAYKKAVGELTPEQRTGLETAAKTYAETQEGRKNGTHTQEEVKNARTEYTNRLNAATIGGKTVIERAKAFAGNDNAKKYAASIDKLGWHNLGGITSGTVGWVSAADREAAARIRDPKNDAGRLHEILKNLNTAPAPAPVPPPGPAPLARNVTKRDSSGRPIETAGLGSTKKLERALDTQTDLLRRNLQELRRSSQATGKGFSNLSQTLRTSHASVTPSNQGFEKRVEKKLSDIEKSTPPTPTRTSPAPRPNTPPPPSVPHRNEPPPAGQSPLGGAPPPSAPINPEEKK